MTVPLNIIAVVGARPNFVKVASLASAFREFPQVDFKILHTGQHYDVLLDEVFFTQLDIPAPFIHLGIGSDTPVRQLARMLPGLEQAYLAGAPDLVIVVGDTSSTLAGALAASKMNIPLAHVEAGLRSGDRSMPEEINRQLTDNLSDFLFVTEQAGMDNLDSEGFPENRVFFTGNCMVDTLVKFREKALGTPLPAGLPTENYVLMTLHRPSNVDTQDGLEALVQMLAVVSREAPVIFPVHPRTRRQLHLEWSQGMLRDLGVELEVRGTPHPSAKLVVGNHVVGGAGKTPTVIALVHALRAAGWRPGVISRGHGRSGSAPQAVHASSDVQRVGDEPLLIARATGAPVFVAGQRAEAAGQYRPVVER